MDRDEMIDALRVWHDSVIETDGELPESILVSKHAYKKLHDDPRRKGSIRFRGIEIEIGEPLTVDGL